MKTSLVLSLGTTDYQKALELQERLHSERKAGAIPDVLLFLEHPHVITMGRRMNVKNILASEETLRKEGIPVFRTGRGGDVTYHGPGQMVVYPIFHLKELGLGVSAFVFRLEEVVIRTLKSLGIEGERIPACRGVFVKGEKICSIGLRISGDVSMHGLALNVNTDLKYFDYIIPCGLNGIKVTSIVQLLGHEVERAKVEEIMLQHFSEVFDLCLRTGSPSNIAEIGV